MQIRRYKYPIWWNSIDPIPKRIWDCPTIHKLWSHIRLLCTTRVGLEFCLKVVENVFDYICKCFDCVPEAFANVTSDVPSFVKQAIAETNLGYVNSKIPLKLKLHCLIKAKGLAEVSGMEEMVHNFLDYKNCECIECRLGVDRSLYFGEK